MILNISSKTNIGLARDLNEDSFFIGIDPEKMHWGSMQENITVGQKGVFIAIADGMGGNQAGEIAAKIATETAKSEFQIRTEPFSIDSFEIIEMLRSIVFRANDAINRDIKSHPERKGMGTTIILGLVFSNHLFLSWCGDSRAYRFNRNGVIQSNHYDLDYLQILTQDHSLVWEYVEAGKMTAEEARLNTHNNIITQSLGVNASNINPGVAIASLNLHDRIVICTDGLNSMVSDMTISEILYMDENTNETCDSLINQALKEGGLDNITLCIIDVLELEENAILSQSEPVVTQMIDKNLRMGKSNWLKRLFKMFSFLILFIIKGKINNVPGKEKSINTPQDLSSDSKVKNRLTNTESEEESIPPDKQMTNDSLNNNKDLEKSDTSEIHTN